MPFDVDQMFEFCQAQIAEFAAEHPDETFYAFAIDANMLCLNSVERFAERLKEYQDDWDRRTRRIEAMSELTPEEIREEDFYLNLEAKCSGLDRSNEQACVAKLNEIRDERRADGCEYRTEEGIRSLREDTGGWDYQGFADFSDDGFDSKLYSDHYHAAGGSEDGHAPTSPYAIAMTELVERLRASNAFQGLKSTDDFYVTWVDHDY